MTRISEDVKLDYADVMLVPKNSSITSRSQVDLVRNFFDFDVVPIIAANMDHVGTFEMALALAKHKVMTALTKHYSVEQLVDFYSSYEYACAYTIYSTGISESDYAKFVDFHNQTANEGIRGPSVVCVDVANGYNIQFLKFLDKFSNDYPEYTLMAGNVCTPERTIELLESGVDVVKIGIGPGSVCTTRSQTGVGYPQLSAVIECSEAARDAGGYIVADGGCTCPGDVAKAFAAGSDFVMLGGMLAGHVEGYYSEENTTANYLDGYTFYGMASVIAQREHGTIEDYRPSEGKAVKLKSRGSVNHTILQILGGLRSACSYIGAQNIQEMHRKAEFVRVRNTTNNVFGKE